MTDRHHEKMPDCFRKESIISSKQYVGGICGHFRVEYLVTSKNLITKVENIREHFRTKSVKCRKLILG